MSDLKEFSQKVDEVTRSVVELVDCWYRLLSSDDDKVNSLDEWSEIFNGSVDEMIYPFIRLGDKVRKLSK